MGSIYRNALSVVVWLGAAADDSGWAIHTMHTILVDDNLNPFTSDKHVDPRSRDSVKHFFARPYWSRMWIIQELNLARTRRVFCGMHEVAWSELYGFVWSQDSWQKTLSRPSIVNERATTLILTKVNDQPDPVDENTPAILRKVHIGNPSATENLGHLVWAHCPALCTDPRDKVYGVISLAMLRSGKWKKGLLLDVDYRKTTEEVFWDFFEKIFVNHVEAMVQQHYLPIAKWNEIWRPEWERYGSRIMAEMSVQYMDVEEKLTFMASKLIRRMEETGKAAGRPPSQLVPCTTTVGGITATFMFPRQPKHHPKGVQPLDYYHDRFCCDTGYPELCTKVIPKPRSSRTYGASDSDWASSGEDTDSDMEITHHPPSSSSRPTLQNQNQSGAWKSKWATKEEVPQKGRDLTENLRRGYGFNQKVAKGKTPQEIDAEPAREILSNFKRSPSSRGPPPTPPRETSSPPQRGPHLPPQGPPPPPPPPHPPAPGDVVVTYADSRSSPIQDTLACSLAPTPVLTHLYPDYTFRRL